MVAVQWVSVVFRWLGSSQNLNKIQLPRCFSCALIAHLAIRGFLRTLKRKAPSGDDF